MVRTDQTDTILTLRALPLWSWFGGAGLLAVGIYIFVSSLGALSVADRYPFAVLLLLGFGLFIVALSIFIGGRADLAKAVFDRSTEEISLERRSLFRGKKWKFTFNEIARNVEIETKAVRASENQHKIYILKFMRLDGSGVQIASEGLRQARAGQIAFECNKFMLESGGRVDFMPTIVEDEFPL